MLPEPGDCLLRFFGREGLRGFRGAGAVGERNRYGHAAIGLGPGDDLHGKYSTVGGGRAAALPSQPS